MSATTAVPTSITAHRRRIGPNGSTTTSISCGSRRTFFYPSTGITPAMWMRVTGNRLNQPSLRHPGEPLLVRDGLRPPDALDAANRSVPFPSLGSQSGTVEQNPDGSTDLYFGPQAPAGKEHNWIETIT